MVMNSVIIVFKLFNYEDDLVISPIHISSPVPIRYR